jgi:hypothetical protein
MDTFAAVPELLPLIRDSRGETEAQRRVAAPVVAALRGAHGCVARLWRAADAEQPMLPDIAAVFGAAHHAMAQGRGAVLAMYSLAGASALYTSSPLERAHRDLHAMAAHTIAQPNYVEDTGRVQLGLKPLNPLYQI